MRVSAAHCAGSGEAISAAFHHRNCSLAWPTVTTRDTAALAAVVNKHKDIVANIVDSNGWTVLMLACDKGGEESVAVLADAGLGSTASKVTASGLSALHIAARRGLVQALPRLLAALPAGAAKRLLQQPDATGLLPQQYAALQGHTRLWLLLHQARAGPSAPLHPSCITDLLPCLGSLPGIRDTPLAVSLATMAALQTGPMVPPAQPAVLPLALRSLVSGSMFNSLVVLLAVQPGAVAATAAGAGELKALARCQLAAAATAAETALGLGSDGGGAGEDGQGAASTARQHPDVGVQWNPAARALQVSVAGPSRKRFARKDVSGILDALWAEAARVQAHRPSLTTAPPPAPAGIEVPLPPAKLAVSLPPPTRQPWTQRLADGVPGAADVERALAPVDGPLQAAAPVQPTQGRSAWESAVEGALAWMQQGHSAMSVGGGSAPTLPPLLQHQDGDGLRALAQCSEASAAAAGGDTDAADASATQGLQDPSWYLAGHAWAAAAVVLLLERAEALGHREASESADAAAAALLQGEAGPAAASEPSVAQRAGAVSESVPAPASVPAPEPVRGEATESTRTVEPETPEQAVSAPGKVAAGASGARPVPASADKAAATRSTKAGLKGAWAAGAPPKAVSRKVPAQRAPVTAPPSSGSLQALQDALAEQHPRGAALDLRVRHVLGMGLESLSSAQLDAAEEVLWSLLRRVQHHKVQAAAAREVTKVVAEETHKKQLQELLASRGGQAQQ